MRTGCRTLLTALAFMAGFPAASHAAIDTSDPGIPPVEGRYVGAGVVRFVGPDVEIFLSDLVLRDITGVVISPVGPDELQTYDWTLRTSAFIQFAPPVNLLLQGPMSLTGPAQSIAGGKAGLTVGEFQTEIISSDLIGNLGGFDLILRESPARNSDGEMSITDLGGGLYTIDGFFDLFLEASIDGGNTWLAADDGMRFGLEPIPIPAPLLLFGPAAIGLIAVRRRERSSGLA